MLCQLDVYRFVVVQNLIPQANHFVLSDQEYEKVREMLMLLKEYAVDPWLTDAIGLTCVDYLILAGRLQLAADLLSPMEVTADAEEAIIVRLWGKQPADVKMYLHFACISLIPRFFKVHSLSKTLLTMQKRIPKVSDVSRTWIAQGCFTSIKKP